MSLRRMDGSGNGVLDRTMCAVRCGDGTAGMVRAYRTAPCVSPQKDT